MSLERNPRKTRTKAPLSERPAPTPWPKFMAAATTHRSAPVLTLEALAYAALFALALATRLHALDAWPLSAAESEQAWAAWQVFRGGRPDPAGLSPLLVYGSSLAFVLMAASDASARLVPALAGSVVVVLPALLRGALGRSGALAAAALLLLSPSFMAFSRALDGSILVAAGSLGLLGCGLALLRTPSPRIVLGAASSAAVLLLGDGSALLPVGVLAVGGWLGWTGASKARRTEILRLVARTRAWAWLAGLVVLLGSGLLANFGTLRSGLVEAPFNWVTGLFQSAATRPWTYYLGAMLGYEPLIWLLVIIAGGRLAYMHLAPVKGEEGPANRPDLVLFVAAWAAAAVVVISLGVTKPAADILLALLPLTLVGAWSLGWLAEMCWRLRVVQTGGAGFAWILFVMLLAAISIANPTVLFGGRFETLERQLQLAQAAIVIVLCVGLVAVCAWLALRLGWRASALSVAATSVALLAALGIHSAWSLAYQPGEREILAPEATSLEVRGLAADVAAASRFVGESATVIQADPSLAHPLAWYLRDYRKVTWSALAAPASARIVILAGEGAKVQGAFLDGYLGRRYRLAAYWQDTISPDASIWGWLSNRTALGAVRVAEVVMYVPVAR